MIPPATVVSMRAARWVAVSCLVAALALAGSVGAASALASAGHPVWDIQSQAQPTTFSIAEATVNNDRYLIQLEEHRDGGVERRSHHRRSSAVRCHDERRTISNRYRATAMDL